ncbi:predicted protein [Histoplasma mississippiense (nom. inval.)]|uniref:predicted protein n=1 Tax=Ajellomyces capsulatus (strain NAm1 / WU24) TaxID=2059318 RepID=UPI000157C604|nr:predicted protein [Histoplasma mississippiense (nom. inval.)]EDN08788.1 predicted protein [Histoplasma mississippiense (nom. inval.)]
MGCAYLGELCILTPTLGPDDVKAFLIAHLVGSGTCGTQNIPSQQQTRACSKEHVRQPMLYSTTSQQVVVVIGYKPGRGGETTLAASTSFFNVQGCWRVACGVWRVAPPDFLFFFSLLSLSFFLSFFVFPEAAGRGFVRQPIVTVIVVVGRLLVSAVCQKGKTSSLVRHDSPPYQSRPQCGLPCFLVVSAEYYGSRRMDEMAVANSKISGGKDIPPSIPSSR